MLTGFDAKLILLGEGGGGRGVSAPNDNASRPGNNATLDNMRTGRASSEMEDEIPF